jgi:plastocyanin
MPRLAPFVFALPALLLTSATPAAPASSIRGQVLVVDDHGHVVQSPPDVYVYLQDVHPPHRRALPGKGNTAEIRQQHQQFDPHVLVVPTGTTVSFPNLDAIEHNVFSPDPPFDLGRYTTNKTGQSRTFEDAGQIEIYCDIHKDMWARIKVIDTTVFGAVQNNAYALDNVPPGTYRVVAWMPDSREAQSDPITVDAAGTEVRVEDLHLQRVEKHAHRRKNGEDYPPYP